MTFQVISTGWACADWIEQTLRSVEEQSVQDFHVQIIYDGGDRGGEVIKTWCDGRDERWRYRLNDTRLWPVRNQYEAFQLLDPADDDIVVWLDLDGDRLAHPEVLAHLLNYYDDQTLVTYGSFRPVPAVETSTPAAPFPQDVIEANSYRQCIKDARGTYFNHLRTMKGKVLRAIDVTQLQWDDGRWREAGVDYAFFVQALELAGPRHKFIEEELLLYNHANPLADYLSHPQLTGACNMDFLSRPPLPLLP